MPPARPLAMRRTSRRIQVGPAAVGGVGPCELPGVEEEDAGVPSGRPDVTEN